MEIYITKRRKNKFLCKVFTSYCNSAVCCNISNVKNKSLLYTCFSLVPYGNGEKLVSSSSKTFTLQSFVLNDFGRIVAFSLVKNMAIMV